jgi:hypothetical protein
MKKFWMALMVAIMGVAVVVSSAEAKRLGGGGSFGKSSPSYSRQAPAQGSGQSADCAASDSTSCRTCQPLARDSWVAPCWALGLGALLSHFGLGGEFASMIGTILMIGLLAFARNGAIPPPLQEEGESAHRRPAFAGPMESVVAFPRLALISGRHLSL